LRRAWVSFLKGRIRFCILLFQLIQLNQLIIKLIFCQVIFVDFLGEVKSSGQRGFEREGQSRKDRLNAGWVPDLSEFGKALPKGAEGHRQTDPDNFYKRST